MPLRSPVIAGCWRMAGWGFSVPQRVGWIEQALDLGISGFDHADIYGGNHAVEALFGEALAARPGLRERVQLITKCGIRLPEAGRAKHYDTRAAHIAASVEASLRALRTDRIDLLLLHRPDPLMRPDEVAAAFAELKRAGKVLAFGVSNHGPQAFAMLHRRLPLLTNQVELSPLQMGALADGTLDQCTDLGLRPMIWSPLAGGRLMQAQGEQALRVRAVLDDLAARHGSTAATMAYAWIAAHPSRPIVVTGSRRPEALREALDAQARPLDAESWARVWQASMGHELP